MAYAEFPHYLGRHDDLSEVIELCKKLEEEYAGTLQNIKDLQQRLTDYESNMDARILQLQQVFIPNAVNIAVENAIREYQSETNLEIQNIKRNLTNLDNKFSGAVDQLKLADSNLLKRIELLAYDTNNRFNDMLNQHRQIIAYVDSKINVLKAETEANLTEQVNRIDNEMAENVRRILEIIHNLPSDGSYVENPVQGLQLTTASQAINDLYDYCVNMNGFSAIEWYMYSRVTADEWSKRNFNCIDWYVNGKRVFRYHEWKNRIFSALTGKYITQKEAIYEIYRILKLGLGTPITAGAYDEQRITAGQYDNMHKDAVLYDWLGIKEGDITNV